MWTRLSVMTCVLSFSLTEPSAAFQGLNCPVSVTLRLNSAEVDRAYVALGKPKALRTQVVLYDTPSLSLLGQGVTIRYRSGGYQDLTVKIRTTPSAFAPSAISGEVLRCETDHVGGDIRHARSLIQKYSGGAPGEGLEFYQALTSDQRKLLASAGVQIPWEQLQSFPVTVTEWTSGMGTSFSGLSLENWEWSAGEMLELRAKADAGAVPAVEAALRKWVASRQLVVEEDQRNKVATFLHIGRPLFSTEEQTRARRR